MVGVGVGLRSDTQPRDRHEIVARFLLEVVEIAHHRCECVLLHLARGTPLGEHAVGADAVDAGQLVPSEG